MDKYRFFALPLIMIMWIVLMIGCGGDGGDSGQDQSGPPSPSVWFKAWAVGPGSKDNGRSAKQTSDGGYIFVHNAQAIGLNKYDFWLVKTDAKGNISWTTSFFGDSSNIFGRSVQQTSDGGYIILGEYTMGSNRQMWLIKTDSNGKEMWDRFYGYGDQQEDASEVQQTSDGGYILVGTTSQSRSNVFLIKTDGIGNTQWYKQKGYDDSNERGASAQQTSDGGYILTGITDQFDDLGDLWLVKVNADGGTAWHNHYGVSNIYDEGTSVRQTTDGGYIIAGETGPLANRDIYLLKTNSIGNQQWSKTLGGPKSDWNAVVQQTMDGGYVIAGSTYSYGAGMSDGYLIKTDATGNTLWTNTFGGSGPDYFYSVQQTKDGGYIMVGSTESYDDGSSDVYIVKTDRDGSSLP